MFSLYCFVVARCGGRFIYESGYYRAYGHLRSKDGWTHKTIEVEEQKLKEGEVVRFICSATMTYTDEITRKAQKYVGVLILAEARILFAYKLAFSEPTVESFDGSAVRAMKCISGGAGFSGNLEIDMPYRKIKAVTTYKREIAKNIKAMIDQAMEDYRNCDNLLKEQVRVVIQTTQTVLSNLQAPNTQQDVLEQIEKLAALKDKNIISEEEYNTKKSELLERL